MLTGYEILALNSESPEHIVPRHDPQVILRYPKCHDEYRNDALHKSLIKRM